jgi:hypothetical protein
MKMKSFGKLLAGISLGSVFVFSSLALKEPIKANAVDSSSLSSPNLVSSSSSTTIGDYLTVGKVIYFNIYYDTCPWYSSTNSYKYAIRFVDANSNVVFSDYMVHAKDGLRFYCATVPANGFKTAAPYASFSVVCYLSTSTSPALDYDLEKTAANGLISLGKTSSVTTPVNEVELKQTNSTPVSSMLATGTSTIVTVSTFTAKTWASTSEGFDRCSIWAQDFVDETAVACNLVGQNTFQQYLNYYWSSNATSYDSLTTNAKAVFTGTIGTDARWNNIINAIARYRRIYYLHYGKSGFTITNFANLTGLTTSSGLIEAPTIGHDDSVSAALVIASTITLLAFGGVALLKRRKTA